MVEAKRAACQSVVGEHGSVVSIASTGFPD